MRHCLKEYQNISCPRLSGKRWFTGGLRRQADYSRDGNSDETALNRRWEIEVSVGRKTLARLMD